MVYSNNDWYGNEANYHKSLIEENHTNSQVNSVTLGLVPAPDLPEELAYKLEDELPDYLAHYVDSHVSWKIEVVIDPLTGATADSAELLEETISCKKRRGWEYAVCLTDLPIFKNKKLVVADASAKHNVAWISLPSLGATPMLRRVLEAILQLTNEMYHGSSETERDRQQKKIKTKKQGNSRLRNKGARQLVGERFYERISPITRINPVESNAEIDVRFIVDSKFSGGVRMLGGMVRANRPWTVFPSFKRVIAAAFATGAYGLIFPTLWELSGAYGITRFILLMVAAMSAMVIWIIVGHGLWEKSAKAKSPYIAQLYNIATALTLSIAVLYYYMILFVLFLLIVTIFVPPNMFAQETGNPVDLTNYLSLAWLASSVATFVGAIGAALESEETIRNATYGYRQRRRYEEMNKEKEKKKR